MNWTKLFKVQKDLDTYIEENHGLTNAENLFEDRCLALLVELGELANETRCFKFWSKKARSETAIILEEYVDGIHFILSIGIVKDLEFSGATLAKTDSTETEQFHKVFAACIAFQAVPTEDNYHALFTDYLQLGALLGFNEADIQTAYYEKNAVNYERQDEGY